MASTFTFQGHQVDTKTGQWCDACSAPCAHTFNVVFAGDDLRLLGTVTATACDACGHLDVTR